MTTSASSEPDPQLGPGADEEAPDWVRSIERSLAEAMRARGRVEFLAPRPGQEVRMGPVVPPPSAMVEPAEPAAADVSAEMEPAEPAAADVSAEMEPAVVAAPVDAVAEPLVEEAPAEPVVWPDAEKAPSEPALESTAVAEPAREVSPAAAPGAEAPAIPREATGMPPAAPSPKLAGILRPAWEPSPKTLLAACTLAFVVFRLVGADATSLGVDDGVSLVNASNSMAHMMSAMVAEHEVHPPLFFYWLHPFVMVASRGSSLFLFGMETWFRLSIVPWLAAVVVLTWKLGVELLGRRGAAVAALLVTVSNYLAYYGLEVRMYPMLSAFLLLATWAAVRLQVGRRPYLSALLCGMACVLAFFTQYLAVVFIAGLMLALALGRGPWTARVLVLAPVVAAGAAWWPILHRQMGAQAMTLRLAPSWPQLLDLLFQMGCGVTWHLPLAGWPELGWLPVHPLKAVVGVVVAALAVYGAKRVPAEGRRLLACMVGVPLVLVFGLSDFTRFHIFEYKYFQPLAPFLFLAVAGLARPLEDGRRGLPMPGILPPGRMARGSSDSPTEGRGSFRRRVEGKGGAWFARLLTPSAALAALLLINAAAWANYQAHPFYYGPQDWRGVLARMAPRFQIGDEVVVHPSMMKAPVYVYASLGDPFMIVVQPGEAPHLALIGVDNASAPDLQQAEKTATRLWLLTTPNHPFVARHRVEATLLAGWSPIEVFETRNQWPANVIRVLLLKRR